MNSTPREYSFSPFHSDGARDRLAQALADAEQAFSTHVGGQADAVIDRQGQVYLLFGAQHELRRNEAQLKEIFASLPDVLWVLDAQGEILSVSPSVGRILGYDESALAGRSFMAFCHPADREAVHHAFSDLANAAASHGIARFRYRAKNGTWIRLEATVGLLPSSQTGRFIVSGRPDAESGNAQLRYECGTWAGNPGCQVERSLAMIAHDLRTPLTPVLFALAELRMDESLGHLDSTFKMMEDNLRLQVRLIDEVRDLAQIGHRKLELLLTPLDAHAAIGAALEVCGKFIVERAIELHVDLGASEFTLLADSLKFQQIIWNVLRNAIKFSEYGGSVSVTSSNPAPGSFLLEISDCGTGIEPSFLPLVFEPFQQCSSSRRNAGGLGLGMYIARGFAEAHHGTLTATSEGLGCGSAFRLRLPTVRSDSHQSCPSEARETAISTGKCLNLLRAIRNAN